MLPYYYESSNTSFRGVTGLLPRRLARRSPSSALSTARASGGRPRCSVWPSRWAASALIFLYRWVRAVFACGRAFAAALPAAALIAIELVTGKVRNWQDAHLWNHPDRARQLNDAKTPGVCSGSPATSPPLPNPIHAAILIVSANPSAYQALVIEPTRELAFQTVDVIAALLKDLPQVTSRPLSPSLRLHTALTRPCAPVAPVG